MMTEKSLQPKEPQTKEIYEPHLIRKTSNMNYGHLISKYILIDPLALKFLTVNIFRRKRGLAKARERLSRAIIIETSTSSKCTIG